MHTPLHKTRARWDVRKRYFNSENPHEFMKSMTMKCKQNICLSEFWFTFFQHKCTALTTQYGNDQTLPTVTNNTESQP